MTEYNGSISNLLQGVSQQARLERRPEQLETQENCFSSVTKGLGNRPGTQLLTSGSLTKYPTTAAYYTYDRGDTLERYSIVVQSSAKISITGITQANPGVVTAAGHGFSNGDTPIFDSVGGMVEVNGHKAIIADVTTDTFSIIDTSGFATYTYGGTVNTYSIVVTDLLTGIDKTVNEDALLTYYLGAYLASSDPKADLRFHTIADTTFILNRSIEPTMSGATASSSIWQSIVYCKKASWGFTYRVISDGDIIAACKTPSSVTLGAGEQDKTITLRTTDIISSLWLGRSVGNAEYLTSYTDAIFSTNKADPCWVSISNHSFVVGDVVKITGVLGMTELNGNEYTVVGVFETNIRIDVDSTGFTLYESGGSCERVNGGLAGGVQDWATAQGVNAVSAEDVIFMSDSTASWGIEAEDANNGNDLLTFGQTIAKYSDLPRLCFDGYKVKVTGIDETLYNDYYVTFNAENGSGIGYGVWEESAGFGVPLDLDPETMPHILTRESDGTFLFAEVPWVARGSGDEDTNPAPSFIGTEISDIMTYQGRLVLVSEENVCASVTFDHYNFFSNTVTTEAADDPIDTASSDNQVTNLHHGLVFNASLVLFSDRAQFVHPSDIAFTTTNFGLSSKTRYKNVVDCQPVASATSIFFPFQSGEFTSIREMQVESSTGNVISDSIAGHVDHYIPGVAEQLVSSTDYNILLVRPSDDVTALYIFQWFNQDDKRKQAAWHKWEFNDSIRHISLIQDKLYIWIEVGSVVSVEYIDLADTDTNGVAFPIRLDHQDEITATSDGDYWKVDATAWITTRGYSRDYIRVVAGDGTGIEGSLAEYEDHPTDADAYRVLKNPLLETGTPKFIVGHPIIAQGEITNPYVRTKDGDPKTKGKLRIAYATFNCSDTGALNIIVQKDNALTYTKEFDTRIIDGDFELDSPQELIDVAIKAAVRSDANRCSIKFYSMNHLPFYITNVDWSGSYYETGRRTV